MFSLVFSENLNERKVERRWMGASIRDLHVYTNTQTHIHTHTLARTLGYLLFRLLPPCVLTKCYKFKFVSEKV